MKFNDVFKANNYAGRKKILDRFPLSKEDKDDVNKSIEKLNNSSGEGGGSNSGGSVSKYAPRYYDISKVSAGTRFDFAASLKGRSGDNIYIFPTMLAGDVRCQEILAFSYIPMYIDFGNESRFIYDAIEFVRLMVGDDEEANEMLSLITEITEEEFYKID